MLFNSYKDNLLDKPSVLSRECAICGRYGTDAHHVIQKGMGGVSGETERRIPKIRLCRYCHDSVHQKRFHINWCESMGGWVYLRTTSQMDDETAWKMYSRHYSPLRGWQKQTENYRTYGATR